MSTSICALTVSLLSLGFSIWTLFITFPDIRKTFTWIKRKWCWHPAFTQKGSYIVCVRCGKGFDKNGNAVDPIFYNEI